jgi:hypothetical protein
VYLLVPHPLTTAAAAVAAQIMYLLALDEFMNKGPAEGDSSYHGIASIHGAGGSYNGQSAPSAG